LSTRIAWIAGVALLLSAGGALADVIDGNWCHPDGRRISISGPQIVTPGGNRLEGHYSRHFFSYVVPATEKPSGQTVYMALLNEFTVHLRVGAEPSASEPYEEWKRCSPSISENSGQRRPSG
jgi:hypothetical protein